MEKPVEGPIGCDVYSAVCRIGPTAAGQDDAVVGIAADDETRPAVQNCPPGGVVKTRIELGDVSPETMPGRPEDVANPVFNGEGGTHLPTVLDKKVHRRRTPG